MNLNISYYITDQALCTSTRFIEIPVTNAENWSAKLQLS